MTARFAPQLGVERRLRQREVAFACAWVLRCEPLDALDPRKRRLAGMDRAIYLYELRMGSCPPRAFYRLCGRSGPPVVQQQTRLMGSRGSQVRRQPPPLARRRTFRPGARVAVRPRGAAGVVKAPPGMGGGAFAGDGPPLAPRPEGLGGRPPPPLPPLQTERALDPPRRAMTLRPGTP